MGEGWGDYWAGSYSYSTPNGPVFNPNWIYTWDGHGTGNQCWAGRIMNAFGAQYVHTTFYSAHVAIPGGYQSDELWSTPLFQSLLTLVEQHGQTRESVDTILLESQFGLGSGLKMRDMANVIIATARELEPGGPHADVFTAKFLVHNIILAPVPAIGIESFAVAAEPSGNGAADPGETAYLQRHPEQHRPRRRHGASAPCCPPRRRASPSSRRNATFPNVPVGGFAVSAANFVFSVDRVGRLRHVDPLQPAGELHLRHDDDLGRASRPAVRRRPRRRLRHQVAVPDAARQRHHRRHLGGHHQRHRRHGVRGLQRRREHHPHLHRRPHRLPAVAAGHHRLPAPAFGRRRPTTSSATTRTRSRRPDRWRPSSASPSTATGRCWSATAAPAARARSTTGRCTTSPASTATAAASRARRTTAAEPVRARAELAQPVQPGHDDLLRRAGERGPGHPVDLRRQRPQGAHPRAEQSARGALLADVARS